ncbi:class I SAM-dependent methyltransferase [Paenibacillus alvei]|uniref:class I SAM-dependent DNA methyltransferase n=1 Tax=Paenibacillus alvei TaxID=44250 RepID=UPI0022851675|nr:class I SAM-dependent methyltransferase [Paenibacillus alvei]MCY9542905.1 class I SAM-dependent methyltransferase [Paenibacillus alvei]
MISYGRIAEVYDRLMGDMPYEQWVSFANQAWERFGSGEVRSIVDLGCGTGNTAIPLAKLGYDVIGIDISDSMLSIANNKLLETGPILGSVRWAHQDMCAWTMPDEADAVVCFCDSLNYVTEEEDVKRAFQATFNNLKSGGLFLFDVLHARQFEEYAETQPFAYDDEDVSYLWFSDYDEERQEIEHQLTLFVRQQGGELYERIDEIHVERAYDPSWLEVMLKEVGFDRVEQFADFAWQSPDEESRRIFMIAVKP